MQRDAGYKLFMMSMPLHGHPCSARHEPSDLTATLKACCIPFVAIGLFSGISNMPIITGAPRTLAGVESIVLQTQLQRLS
jgi:hypothetical protein